MSKLIQITDINTNDQFVGTLGDAAKWMQDRFEDSNEREDLPATIDAILAGNLGYAIANFPQVGIDVVTGTLIWHRGDAVIDPFDGEVRHFDWVELVAGDDAIQIAAEETESSTEPEGYFVAEHRLLASLGLTHEQVTIETGSL